jgi:mannose-6-phosphate isomerase-like protein (cupin superfamily)
MEKHRIDSTGFRVVAGTERSQAAFMTLEAGETTGGPNNRHPSSDQWLFVAQGSGTAIVDGVETPLEAGDLLLIVAGEAHELRAAADAPLVTVNVYAPPEY